MDRREFLQTSGWLVVSFALVPALTATADAAEAAPTKSMNEKQLDAWLAIAPDGKIIVYTGKVDLGTGTRTALAQMVADELDVRFERIDMVMGDTATTIDQGMTAGSVTIPSGQQLRRAAATARQALLAEGAKQLGANPSSLVVQDGIISAAGGKSIAYADLARDGKLSMVVNPDAPLKKAEEYKIVGTSVPRVDIPAKVTGEFTYMQDFRLPGMLHARVIRPAGIGSTLESYDDSALSSMPGFVKVVRKQNFLAVVARDEWAAVQCARKLKTSWSKWEGLPDEARLYEVWRALPVVGDDVTKKVGDARQALATAPKRLKATYEFPMQSHASMGPACAVADFRDGKCTIWSPSQATHQLRVEIADIIGVAKTDIRLIYIDGAGCYGRSGHEDCTADAALVSKLAGAPVRVQWMREDELGWDPKSPPHLIDFEAGLDASGRVVAWRSEFFVSAQNGNFDDYPLLAAVESGVPRKTKIAGNISGNSAVLYAFPNSLTEVHRVDNPLLRMSHLRAPGRIQNVFANESFIDEVAAAARIDPVAFRLEYLADARGQAVIARTARMAQWGTRPSGAGVGRSEVAYGRGFAYAKYSNTTTEVALALDATVNRKTGKIRVTRAWCAHDCGQVINPDGVKNQVEGAIMQTISRTILEEVRFDRSKVTSVDWASYPILRFPDVPEIKVELIDRPNEAPWGAGEMSATVVPAAISNAVFDATGARLRSVPFTPEKVLAALKAQRT